MIDDELVNNIKKLQWACRRGMLELDVLLGNFLKNAYPDLGLEEKRIFVRLLGCSDPELFAWLVKNEEPEDREFAIITDLIRRHARSRV